MNSIEKKNVSPDFTTEIFWTYESLQSNEILMFCELIDNSIASATNNDFMQNLKDLSIEILIDETKKEKEIIIFDNAKGFTFETLKEGLNLGRHIKKDGTSFYNKGLKQSAFWSGEYLEIKTVNKQKQELSVKIDLPFLELNNNGIVNYDIEISENQNGIISPVSNKTFKNGTIIKFKKLFSYRWKYESLITRNKSFTDKNLFLIMLRTKYEFLLKNGLSIRIEWKTNDESRSFNEEIKPLSILPENFYEWAKYTYENDKRYKESGKIEYSSFNNFYSYLKDKFLKNLDESLSKINPVTSYLRNEDEKK